MISNLTIIYPIFNEENRLPKSFFHIIKYLKYEKNRKIELILVDGGRRGKILELIKRRSV